MLAAEVVPPRAEDDLVPKPLHPDPVVARLVRRQLDHAWEGDLDPFLD
jgi:hypothetical protein